MHNRQRERVNRRWNCSAALCICIGVLLVFSAQAQAEQDREAEASRHFAAGQCAQNAGDYATAVQEFQSVVGLVPRVAEAYASLGLAYNAEGKFSESAQALRKAQKLKPNLPGVNLYLGINLVKMRQPADAVAPLREALHQEPENRQPWLWLATALGEAGQPDDEIDELQQARRRFPADSEVLFRLGEIYRQQAEQQTSQLLMRASGQPLVHQIYGDIYQDEQTWTKATGHYRSATALDSRWAGAHLGMGQVAMRQGLLDMAGTEFEQELAVNPHSASAEAGLASVALMQGNAQSALMHLNGAIHISAAESAFALGLPATPVATADDGPKLPADQLRTARTNLAQAAPGAARALALAFVNLRLGDADGTETAWKEFEQSAPQMRPTGVLQQAQEDFYRRKLDSASAEIKQWLKTNPVDLSASYLLVRTERALSLSLLGQLLNTDPDSVPAHQLMAESEENAENYEKAAMEYHWVEQRSPELPGIHYALGRMLLKIGNRDGAAAEFTAELRLDPDHPGANAELGAMFIEEKKTQDGVVCLERALRYDPDLWQAHRELGKALLQLKSYARAETELQKALVDDPEGLAYYQLGILYRAQGRADLARQMFSHTQQLKSDRLAAQNGAPTASEVSQP